MIKIILRVIKYTLISLLFMLLIGLIIGCYLYFSADRSAPNIKLPAEAHDVVFKNGYSQYDSSVLRLNSPGLWELHLKGEPQERGLAFGQLCKELMFFQEKAFVDQIKTIVPNTSYLTFLKYLTVIYNRDLAKNIPEEYLKEIYASSLACSKDFDFIGNAFDRQLNYHAAHDLGHAMQEYMLVGCSSFGVWGSLTRDSSLIIARNFDFYVGDDFAKNKIVSFFYPDRGYKFASVGWAGMVGVLSGMNEKGLTVTINAAKSDPPTQSKTPISIIAREILQYSSNIQQAFEIAKRMDAFVSESILIGSASDGKAAIIEKSPKYTNLYLSKGDIIISTNHFQSDFFINNKQNSKIIDAQRGGHSEYRYDRLQELISSKSIITPIVAAEILRDYNGINNKKIGLTNEKSINQFIAHHAVIFDTKKRIMWVSTHPWQLGAMIAYNLDSIFKQQDYSKNANNNMLTIPADSLAINGLYKNIINFRAMVKVVNSAIKNKITLTDIQLNRIIDCNPNYYHSYELIGDYYRSKNQIDKAIKMYQMALSQEVTSEQVRENLIENLNKLKTR